MMEHSRIFFRGRPLPLFPIRRLGALASLCALLCLFGCSGQKAITEVGPGLEWMEGQWVGLGYQPNSIGQTVWPISLKVDLEKKTCLVDYPSFPCNGHLELVKAEGRRAYFVERIDEGKGSCYDKGLLILTFVDENHLSYSFFFPEEHRLGSFSTLTRESYHQSLNQKTL